MIKYNQTINSNLEIPKISGYKKQFSIEIPRGEEETVEEQPIEETPVEEPTPITKGTITLDSGVKVGNMQEVLDKFAEAGISVRVTSGVRNASNRSHHIKGNAVDIVPGKGETWDSMRKKIKENESLKNWLRSKKIGIIDETVAETMKKTGATGLHWHVGPDKWALKDFEAIFAKAGTKLPMMQRVEDFDKIKALLKNWY